MYYNGTKDGDYEYLSLEADFDGGIFKNRTFIRMSVKSPKKRSFHRKNF